MVCIVYDAANSKMHHYLKFMKHIHHVVHVYIYMYIYTIDIVCINICFCFVGLRSDSTFPKTSKKVPVSTMALNSPCRILLVYHPRDCDSDLGHGVDSKATEVHRGSVVWRVRFPPHPPVFWRNLGGRLAGYLEDRDQELYVAKNPFLVGSILRIGLDRTPSKWP